MSTLEIEAREYVLSPNHSFEAYPRPCSYACYLCSLLHFSSVLSKTFKLCLKLTSNFFIFRNICTTKLSVISDMAYAHWFSHFSCEMGVYFISGFTFALSLEDATFWTYLLSPFVDKFASLLSLECLVCFFFVCCHFFRGITASEWIVKCRRICTLSCQGLIRWCALQHISQS